MRKIFGNRFYEALMRSTFFGHFTAGATDEEISRVVNRMNSAGITSAICYSVEADLHDQQDASHKPALKEGHYHDSDRVLDINLNAVTKSIDTAAGTDQF